MIFCMDYWGEWQESRKRGNIVPGRSGYLHQNLGHDWASNIIRGLGTLLAYDAFLRTDTIRHLDLAVVKKFVPRMLDNLFLDFPRVNGAKHKLIKNHLPLHLVFDIMRWGVPANLCSSIGELWHKEGINIPGRTS